MGGFIGLAGAMVIGPAHQEIRRRKAAGVAGHDVPMVVLGVHPRAGLVRLQSGSPGTDLRISYVVVNTMLASVTGALGAMATLSFKGLKPDRPCSAMVLAGLVAITAPCAFADLRPPSSAASPALVVHAVFFWERAASMIRSDPSRSRHQRPLGRVLVGIFATGNYGAGWNGVVRPEMVAKYGSDGVRGLLYGDAGQLVMQSIDCLVVASFGFAMAYAWFKLSNLITPIRVSKETELEGLDGPEMGTLAYPDFAQHSGGRNLAG